MKGPRGTTVKHRTVHEATAADGLTEETGRFVAERLAGASVRGVDWRTLRPVLHTTYRRSTLLLPGGRARMPVDSGLTWRLPGGRVTEAADVVGIETKSPPGAASSADRILWEHGHRPRRISKFGTGLALLRPDLPANKWHRVSAEVARRPS